MTLGKRITVWSVEERKRIGVGPPLAHASEVDISPDGGRVVAKNTEGEIVVLATDSREEIGRFRGLHGEGAEIRFSPDGNHIVDGSCDGHLTVRDPYSGEVLWEESEEGAPIAALTCTRDRGLWVYHRGSAVYSRLWPFSEHSARLLGNVPDRVAGLAVTEDRSSLALTGYASIRVWRVDPDGAQPGVEIAAKEIPYGGSTVAVAWHPPGRFLARAEGIAQLVTPRLQVMSETAPASACDVEFTPDGHLLALGDWSKGIVVAAPAVAPASGH